MDYDDIPAANPETTAITPVNRKNATIPTNYPIATSGVSVLLFFSLLVSFIWIPSGFYTC